MAGLIKALSLLSRAPSHQQDSCVLPPETKAGRRVLNACLPQEHTRAKLASRLPPPLTHPFESLRGLPDPVKPRLLFDGTCILSHFSLPYLQHFKSGRREVHCLSSWTNTKREKVSPQTRFCLKTQFSPQEKADGWQVPRSGRGDTAVGTSVTPQNGSAAWRACAMRTSAAAGGCVGDLPLQCRSDQQSPAPTFVSGGWGGGP